MYTVDTTTKNAFLSGALESVSIAFPSLDITLTSGDIRQKSFSINSYNTNGDYIEIGSTVASECSFTVENYDGRWDETDFLGKEFSVAVSVTGGTASIPYGVYIVDTVEVKSTSVIITALDRMVNLDVMYDNSFYGTAKQFLTSEVGGITFDNDIDDLLNINVGISIPENSGLTIRGILGQIATITGNCLHCTRQGTFKFSWYPDATSITGMQVLDKTVCHSMQSAKSPTPIVGVYLSNGSTSYLAKRDSWTEDNQNYVLAYENLTILGDLEIQTVATALKDNIVFPNYLPFEASTLSMPWVDVFDVVEVYDGKLSIITENTFTLNGATELLCKGNKVQTRSGVSQTFTASQQTAISSIETQVNPNAGNLIRGLNYVSSSAPPNIKGDVVNGMIPSTIQSMSPQPGKYAYWAGTLSSSSASNGVRSTLTTSAPSPKFLFSYTNCPLDPGKYRLTAQVKSKVYSGTVSSTAIERGVVVELKAKPMTNYYTKVIAYSNSEYGTEKTNNITFDFEIDDFNSVSAFQLIFRVLTDGETANECASGDYIDIGLMKLEMLDSEEQSRQITEFGSDGSWTWRKYANGTVELWYKQLVSLAAAGGFSTWGSLYHLSPTRQTLPFAIKTSGQYITATYYANSSSGSAWLGAYSAWSAFDGITLPPVDLLRPTQNSANFRGYIHWYIKGEMPE